MLHVVFYLFILFYFILLFFFFELSFVSWICFELVGWIGLARMGLVEPQYWAPGLSWCYLGGLDYLRLDWSSCSWVGFSCLKAGLNWIGLVKSQYSVDWLLDRLDWIGLSRIGLLKPQYWAAGLNWCFLTGLDWIVLFLKAGLNRVGSLGVCRVDWVSSDSTCYFKSSLIKLIWLVKIWLHLLD